MISTRGRLSIVLSLDMSLRLIASPDLEGCRTPRDALEVEAEVDA